MKKCKNGHKRTPENTRTYISGGKKYQDCLQCAHDSSARFRDKQGKRLPPETESVMASYKEPLKPVQNGFGYYGTIAYSKDKKYTQCHLCGYFFKNLGKHVSQIHNKSAQQYRIEMSLPTTLSLSPPETKHKNWERWNNMTDEEKKASIGRMRAGLRGRRQLMKTHRGKSLYHKNLEGRCPDQLLDKILKLQKKLGETPSIKQFVKEYGHGYRQSVVLTFGTYGEALKILNLQMKTGGGAGYGTYDRATLLKLGYDFKERYGRLPMSSDTERGLLPHRSTYAKHFGSWTEAKELMAQDVSNGS